MNSKPFLQWGYRVTALSCFGMATAFAQFTPISTPNSTYTSTTTVIPIASANGTTVTTLSSGAQTLTLSPTVSARAVPGGGWSTWNSPPAVESATPRVLAVYTSRTTQTITLSAPSTTFGVEIEPDTFAAFSFSLAFMNGSTTLGTITRTVDGNGGALLFAASSSTPITSVVLTAPSGANGFALAQLRYGGAAPVGTPISNSALITLTGLLAIGGLSTMRRSSHAA